MSTYPLVTVLIPTYNQAGYLKQAIESVLMQDYPNFEVIIGDDNSSDATTTIVAGYVDARLKYHKNETNLGRVRNYHDLLYNHAKGDWVINLDGDDYFIDSSFISEAMSIASTRTNLAIIFFARYELTDFEIASFAPNKKHNQNTVFFKGEDYLLSWPRKSARIHHLTALYLRSLATEVGFYTKNIISSDYESLFKLMLLGDVCYVNKKIAVWRKHELNASLNKSVDDKIADLTQFTSVAEFARDRFPRRKKAFDRWLKRNLTRKLYTYTLSATRNRDWQRYLKIKKFYKDNHPDAYYSFVFNPLCWCKILLHTVKDFIK